MSKTELVRAYLSEHPEAGNKEIVEALAQQGQEIAPNYVSMIKSKAKKREPFSLPLSPISPNLSSSSFQDQLRAERDHLKRKLNAIELLLE